MNKLLTVNELAEILDIKPNTLRQMARQGAIPTFKVGRVYRFDLDLVLQFFQQEPLSEKGKTECPLR